MEMEKREMVGMAFLQPAPLLRDVRFQAGATFYRCINRELELVVSIPISDTSTLFFMVQGHFSFFTLAMPAK